MTIDATGGLIGLSLLGGTAPADLWSSPATESRAVRIARAQYLLRPVTPPWKESRSPPLLSSEVAAIKLLRSIVEPARSGLPADVATAFTAYKAIDRLRALAEASVKGGDAGRAALSPAFARGMADLAGFLAEAPGDLLTLSMDKPGRRAQSVALAAAPQTDVAGKPVAKQRGEALSGLSGTERFEIRLSKTGGTDTVTVDLAGTSQPPTLDSVAAALNAAIAAIPLRNPDGSLALDVNGQEQPRWLTNFIVTKGSDGWGLKLQTMGIERVSVSQLDAPSTLAVAIGAGITGGAAALRQIRIDDPAGAMVHSQFGEVRAIDTLATAEAMLRPAPKPLLPGGPVPSRDVAAGLDVRASVSDSAGNLYVVGSSAGALGANRGDGGSDLVLTKLDSRGDVVWHQALGAQGTGEGAAIALGPNGDIVVAGTVSGAFDGATSDGDMLVARFGADGAQQMTSLVRAVGADTAQAVAVAADGSIVVGGRSASGDALLARIDPSGRLVERRSIDGGGNDSVRALAFAGDGSLVAVTQENGGAVVRRLGTTLADDRASLALGNFEASALALDGAGGVVVAGTGAGGQGGRDAIVARVDAALTNASTSVIGSAGDDRADSIALIDGQIYVGGRTSGALGGAARTGAVDGFVARIDAVSGAVSAVHQWGQAGETAAAVEVNVSHSDAGVRALGFASGELNPEPSARLIDQTSLRAGEYFSVRVDGGAPRRIVVETGDTLKSFAERLGRLAGRAVKVTAAHADGGEVLRIEAQAGHRIDLIAGSGSDDALARLGLAPQQLVAALPVSDKAPRVRPGGNFGLDLSPALNLRSAASAALALDRMQAAISTSRSAFRSLYWDDNKAAIVDGAANKGKVSPYEAAQLGRYRDALTRLTAGQPTANLFGQ